MKIRLLQVKAYPAKGDLAANYRLLMGILDQVQGERPDVVITPEGFLDGYIATEAHVTRENIGQYATDVEDSPYVKGVAAWAAQRGSWVVLGCARRAPEGVYNSALIFDRQGALAGVFDKVHCRAHDQKYVAGSRLPVFEADFGTFGVMICADRRWPETVRILALKGARVIFNPTYGNHNEMNRCLMRTRSFENELFIAFTHPAQSLVTGPKGEILVDEESADARYAVCEIDLAQVDRIRSAEQSFLKDRRAEVYQASHPCWGAGSAHRGGGERTARRDRWPEEFRRMVALGESTTAGGWSSSRERSMATDSVGEWTPRRRFHAALRGQMPDRVPAVVWNNKLPGGEGDRALLDAGVCVVVKSSVYDVEYAGVEVEQEEWLGEDGHRRARTTYRTPCGDLQEVHALRPGTRWRLQPLWRGPQDYDALIALAASETFVPRYERFLEDDARYGDSGVARPATEATPLREMIYHLLGVEAFALEWYDHRDHLLALYQALLASRRRRLPLLAASPAPFFVVEANIAFDIVGRERFRQLCLPAIEEACDLLHAAGKLAGAHLDGRNRSLAPQVAQTGIDFVESFTPPPDCDLPLSQARRLWPGKALCCHFPSSVHLAGPEAVRARVRELMVEAAPGAGFLLGAMEDVPRPDVLRPLAQAIWELGKLPLSAKP